MSARLLPCENPVRDCSVRTRERALAGSSAAWAFTWTTRREERNFHCLEVAKSMLSYNGSLKGLRHLLLGQGFLLHFRVCLKAPSSSAPHRAWPFPFQSQLLSLFQEPYSSFSSVAFICHLCWMTRGL